MVMIVHGSVKMERATGGGGPIFPINQSKHAARAVNILPITCFSGVPEATILKSSELLIESYVHEQGLQWE